MDKVKAILEPVAKYWFWIMSGVVMIGSLAIWWLASGRLVSEFEIAKSKIESDAARVTSVSSKLSEHPNPKTQAEMDKLIKTRKQEVLDAWTSVYKRQQDILVWPVAELTEDFVREFRNLTPIETKFEFGVSQEKETSLLNSYGYYIGNVLPGIAEIAKTKWTASFDRSAGSAGGMGGYEMGGSMGSGMGIGSPGGMMPDEGPLVRWDTASQETLLTDLFPWRGGQPSTLQVLYSQENLWILRQLMQIIASVNGDAGQRFQAKIHDINRISIGSSVKSTAGTISKPSMNMPGGMMGGMDMGGMEMGGMEMSGGMDSAMGFGGDGSMMGGAMTAVDPGDNRYVDTTGKPLTSAALRAALSSNQPADAFMAVAKRIPIMMSLRMDQRSVPDLIAKCGSAALMVEVKQVRILPSGTSSGAGGMGGGYEMGGSGESGMGGYGMESGMDSGMGMAGPMMPATGGTGAEQFPLDLDVEVYGIIYIYNPPLEEKLGVEKVTEDTIVEGTSMLDNTKIATPTPITPEALPAPTPLAPSAVDQSPADATGTSPAGEVPSGTPGPAPVGTAPPADGALWTPRKDVAVSIPILV